MEIDTKVKIWVADYMGWVTDIRVSAHRCGWVSMLLPYGLPPQRIPLPMLELGARKGICRVRIDNLPVEQ